ncbi:MAG: ATP-dependent DNA helicase RecG [Clostridia bacterium]|nr:ATP-dependent DNA helicase RecG [Clostridia bacterium]
MSVNPLAKSVSSIYGIGEAVRTKLEKIGVFTVFDLLNFYPRKYEDWSDVSELYGLNDGELITIKARVKSISPISAYDKLQKCVVVVGDDYGTISLTFFHGKYVAAEMHVGDEYYFRGVVTMFRGGYQLVNPQRLRANKVSDGYIRPVYRQTGGISSKQIEAWIGFALRDYAKYLENIVPKTLAQSEALCSTLEAYQFVHRPQTFAQAEMGRKRLAYEELIVYEYGMHKMNSATNDESAKAFKVSRKAGPDAQKLVSKVVSNMPFELTDDQKKAIGDIFNDISSDKPMNRLIQGDVGSGKTAVAAVVMAACAATNQQAALLAPTSVLARQHYDTISKFYKDTGIDVVFVYGGMKESEKKEVLQKISSGEAKVIIGTHAIIQKDVKFYNLALFITDEQQRFGVEQRNEKLTLSYVNSDVNSVHNLVMSATPIPRTLAMVIYGDMNISIIRQKPAGRKAIKTKTVNTESLDPIFAFMAKLIEKGDQIYVVAPRIDDNDEGDEIERYYDLLELEKEKIETYSVKGLQKLIKASRFLSGYKSDILNGSMSDSDKEKVMNKFISGKTHILISTTVVEVGVNNPNATGMIIMDSDRFGLSTLHQLRGRVGRGDKQSYCILATSSKSELALERLNIMCQCDDGFELAEKDLALRGPGDFFGTRQHGLPKFKVVNIFDDAEKSVKVRDAMVNVMAQDDEETRALLEAIERQLDLRYPNREILRA